MENIEAMLCAYVEGDLDATGKAQIEKHLQDNPQHRKLLDELVGMRELVRALPRAKAPMDVGDSLRQKVERSLLLEDAVAAPPQRQRVDRWPQFFGIAAVFLLFASLCFILYKALGPTLKPAVFTQSVAEKMPDSNPPANELVEGSAAPDASKPVSTEGNANNGKPDDLKSGDVKPGTAVATDLNAMPATLPSQLGHTAGILQQAQTVIAQSQQQVVAVAQLDLQAIRRRLESSGYGVNGGGANPQPVLMVVNSTDIPATKAQITQFLSNNTGISWKAVPSDQQTKSTPTTLPDSVAGERQAAAGINATSNKSADDVKELTAEPVSDLYVARGLTPERADALRQTLTIPQNGPEVQVTMQSAQGLATTQPSLQLLKDVNALGLRDDLATANATTRPTETANAGADLQSPASTMPSASGAVPSSAAANSAMNANDGSGAILANAVPATAGINKMSANNQQFLLPVDAVIVVQNPGPGELASPTTQPASPAQSSPAAPEAAPSAAPASPATRP